MKNVDLLLSIAFITDDDIVFDIAEVKPWTEDNHYPTRAGSYTLEMNRGWLARKGVKPNIKVGGLPH